MKLKDWPNKPMTVNQLYAAVSEQLRKGNGDKYIFIGDDDEGNGFHALFWGFLPDEDIKDYADVLYQIDDKKDLNKIVVLG